LAEKYVVTKLAVLMCLTMCVKDEQQRAWQWYRQQINRCHHHDGWPITISTQSGLLNCHDVEHGSRVCVTLFNE